jgi:ubiquinone/menaquinone biosynthesis C-methylase UbiE
MTAIDHENSRRFWNEKARENPYWYVSACGPYGGRDLGEFWDSGPRIWQDLKEALGYQPRAGHTVVEVGCGVGRLTRAIAPEVAQVHAFDISEEMLTLARKHGLGNVTFHRTDGSSLTPLANASADLVLAYCVFQHLPSEAVLRAYLLEMARVGRPGGRIAFTLTPRDWTTTLLPMLRAQRWLRETLGVVGGARGLYRQEWTGIRPSSRRVLRMSAVPLGRQPLHGDKWLFHGTL